MRSRWLVVVCLVGTMTLAACSHTPSSTSRVDSSAAWVASTMDPAIDGFSFGNFTAADSGEQFDVGDLKSMYGAGTDVCLYGDAVGCVPTAEAAAYARMVNMARSAGHCEGLVVRAAELFAQTPETPTSRLSNSGEVTHGIIRKFATQLHGEVRREAESWSSRSLAEIVGRLRESLRGGRVEYTMGLYTQSGGHTVLPYAMRDFADGTTRLSVYDPNWPGAERFVDINAAEGRWTFSFDATDPLRDERPWTGARGTIDLVSLSGRVEDGCPFCGDKPDDAGSTLLIRSTDNDWNVTTRNGVLTAGSSSEVAGNVRPLRATTSARDYVVALDASHEVSLTLKSSTRISAMMPQAMVEIEVVDPASPLTIQLSNSGVATSGARATVTVARGFLGARATGEAVTLRHDGSVITGSVVDEGRTSSIWSTASKKLTSPDLSKTEVELPIGLRRRTDFVPVTIPPSPTTIPEAVIPVVGQTVRVTFDVSRWKPASTSTQSYGFEALDVIGGESNDTQVCRSIGCLGRKVVWVPRGGVQADSDAIIVSPYSFQMRGVPTRFDVRCGNRGRWVSATENGGSYFATCSIGNVTRDEVVAVRAS